ncbi:MAG: gliding motility-associated C-terminal domain-containing protein, partial [Elusimicrobiota bacterium]
QRGTLGAGHRGIAAEGGGRASAAAAGDSVEHLGMFWNNGLEYKKLYGKVDPVGQTVSVETVNLGKFQIRSVFREGGVTFDLSNITSRIFTPNNDGKNDVVLFLFDNPRKALVEGVIYDLRGARVASMTPGLQPDTLMWDGRMDGRTVTSGVYIYQIKAEGKTFNGTVVVAR